MLLTMLRHATSQHFHMLFAIVILPAHYVLHAESACNAAFMIIFDYDIFPDSTGALPILYQPLSPVPPASWC